VVHVLNVNMYVFSYCSFFPLFCIFPNRTKFLRDADYASKPVVACTNYNRSDSRATQCASPLAYRLPDDDSASNNHMGNFFIFFQSSSEKEISLYNM